ncbi:hypothetical protein ACFU8W_47970 [Streptomyces sp. NPDC057565]|uniref:hypothetical protein n=1 Tax=Streptomyces sp. NPDC057565 TaxID=3346169 RepID=UPI00367AF19B
MSPASFNDPELQAIYTYLAPGGSTGRQAAANAEAIAACEGLDLGADLSAARRRAPEPTCSVRRSSRRTLQDHAYGILRAQAAAWADLRMWRHETEAWIHALGADGAPVAAACLRLGIGLMVMDIVLDGQSTSRRLRGGDTPTSVQARAAALGIPPSRLTPERQAQPGPWRGSVMPAPGARPVGLPKWGGGQPARTGWSSPGTPGPGRYPPPEASGSARMVNPN